MNSIIENILFWAGFIIAALGGIGFWLWIISVLIDHLKKRIKVLSLVVEYIYYRAYFKKWFEENQGKRPDEL